MLFCLQELQEKKKRTTPCGAWVQELQQICISLTDAEMKDEGAGVWHAHSQVPADMTLLKPPTFQLVLKSSQAHTSKHEA